MKRILFELKKVFFFSKNEGNEICRTRVRLLKSFWHMLLKRLKGICINFVKYITINCMSRQNHSNWFVNNDVTCMICYSNYADAEIWELKETLSSEKNFWSFRKKEFCISSHSSEIDKVKAIHKISIVIYVMHPNLLDFYKFLLEFIMF